MARPTIGRFAAGAAIVLALLLAAPSGSAQTPQQQRIQSQQQTREQIYGRQLMTPAEVQAYQARMRSLKTEQERRAFREEHHREMQERARKRGIKLPVSPPAQAGQGAGPTPGGAGGMGKGPGQGRKK